MRYLDGDAYENSSGSPQDKLDEWLFLFRRYVTKPDRPLAQNLAMYETTRLLSKRQSEETFDRVSLRP